MTILQDSPIQNSGNYFTNNDEFDSQIFFTDINPTLYMLVFKRYSNTTLYNLLYSAKLDGYNNNTDFNYRFDLSKYINFNDVTSTLEFNKLNNIDTIQYIDNNNCEITVLISKLDMLNIYSLDGFIFEENGDINIEYVDILYLSEYNDINILEYVFIDKVNDNNVEISLSKVIKDNSWYPISTYTIPQSFPTTFASENVKTNGDFINGLNGYLTSGGGTTTIISNQQYIGMSRFLRREVLAPNNGLYFNISGLNIGAMYTISFLGKANLNTNINYGVGYEVVVGQLTTSWKKFSVSFQASTNNTIIFYPTAPCMFDIANIKLELGSVSTYWTPSITDYEVSFICYNNGTIVNQLNIIESNENRTFLIYIPEGVTNYYIKSPNKTGFFGVDKLSCAKQLWYKSINAPLDMIYTTGNEHKIESTTKEFITINNKKFPTKLITQKSIKINTGFGLNQDEVYSLIKSPYVYKNLSPTPYTIGRNIIPNSYSGVDWTSDTKNNGEYSVTRSATTETGYIFSPTITLKSNTTYTLSFKSKQSGSISPCDLFIYKVTSEFLRVTSYTNSTSYTSNSFTFSTGNDKDIDGVKVRFDHNGGNGTNATIFIKDVKLEEGSVATPYSLALEDLNPNPIIIDTKRYTLNTSIFEGYNGSNLSEKNIELVIEDEKQFKRRTNIELNFFY